MESGFHLVAELLVRHLSSRVADDGEAGGNATVVGEPVKSGNELALGKVAIRAEDHDGTRRDATLKPKWVLKRIRLGHVLQTYQTSACAHPGKPVRSKYSP